MPADPTTPKGFSLRRWSRRKLEASRVAMASEAPAPATADPVPPAPPIAPSVAGEPAAPAAAAPALPPVESLTPDSDFTAFMQPKVDEDLRRQALRKLFADPRFNVMDGLDVYIDDYTKADPIPPSVLERLAQSGFVRGLGAPAPEAPPASPPAVVPSQAAAKAATEAPRSHVDQPPAAAAPPAPPDPPPER